MKNLLLLAIFCIAILISAEEKKNFYIKSVNVAEKKANGKYWDVSEGNPDVMVVVYAKTPKGKWEKYFTSPTAKDVFNVGAPMDVGLKVAADSEIKVEVIDDDPMGNDKVGDHVIKFSDKDAEETKVSFGQVVAFEYVVTGKSFKEYLAELEERKKPKVEEKKPEETKPEETKPEEKEPTKEGE